MTLEELRACWRGTDQNSGSLQRQIWDRVAEDYYRPEVPDFNTDPFLRQVETFVPLDRPVCSLDIGCGAGRYTLALARRGGRSVGVDVSPRMIALAERSAQEHGLPNAVFQCVNWAAADIDAMGLRGAFDLVFAHMTPAIADYRTFEKMVACSRKYCMMEKPSRRTDKVQDAAFAAAGVEPEKKRFDQDILYAFSYLWLRGYSPKLQYRQEVWRNKRTPEDMAAWCIDRAKLRRRLDPADEEAIRGVVAAHTEAGMVEEVVTSTIVTMYWEV